jgi:hypothetical protein
MKKTETPLFNPVLLPDVVVPKARKTHGRARARTPKPGFTARVKQKARRLTQRIKAGLNAKFAHLDSVRLKKALIACGIAAAIAAAIVFLAKFTPLIVAMLTLLGLGAVLQLWDRVRGRLPI